MLAQVARVATIPMTISMVTRERVGAQQPAQRELGARPDAQPQRRAARQHRDRRQNGQRGGRPAPPGRSGWRSTRRSARGSRRAAMPVISRAAPVTASRSAPPKVRRSRPVRTPITMTANSTSREAPSSTISGTPAVSRNAVAAIPLSSIRNPAACDTACRRVTITNSAMSTTASSGRDGVGGGRRLQVHQRSGDGERGQRQRGGDQQRGGGVHQRGGLAVGSRLGADCAGQQPAAAPAARNTSTATPTPMSAPSPS